MPLKTVDAPTLKSWMDKGEALVVDVREPGEYAAEHIPGATLLPIGNITKPLLPAVAGKKLVLHCRGGTRGGKACEKLLTEDPTLELYHLKGGLSAWSQAGYKTQKSGKSLLPLDRQVQLTIGSGVLIGIMLGYLINPAFLLLAALFGAGLVNAGLTGWCGLAMLLAKMPWNQSQPSNPGVCHV